MRVLDLFCGAGAAAKGYNYAGFDIIGVDRVDQPNYPFEFHKMDAMEVASSKTLIKWLGIDVIHASPPCQGYSLNTRHMSNDMPRLIKPLREMLEKLNVIYVIENVPGAPLYGNKTITLCGTMFGKKVYRHRLFECNVPLDMYGLKCDHSIAPMNIYNSAARTPTKEWVKEVLGEEPWMSQKEARQGVSPYFTEFIGLQLASHF